jgi:hypothetical protein
MIVIELKVNYVLKLFRVQTFIIVVLFFMEIIILIVGIVDDVITQKTYFDV